MEKYSLLLDITKNMLGSLSHLLDKAGEYVKEKGVEESTLLNATIAPDMFNFTRQVQIATDDARRSTRLLAGKEHIVMEDTETTINELKERVAKSLAVVNELKVEDFEGADDRHVSLYWMGEMYVEGRDFIKELAITNFLFHVVTAYDILRKEGVQVGKSDYITVLSMKPKSA